MKNGKKITIAVLAAAAALLVGLWFRGAIIPDLHSSADGAAEHLELTQAEKEQTELPESPSVNDAPVGKESSGAADARKETAADHGYPFLLAEHSVDLDGDKNHDKVKLFQEWYPIYNEQGVPSYARGLLHYARVEFEINGNVYSYTWDEPSYGSELSIMQNADGTNLCVVTLDVGGTGAGNLLVFPLAFDGGISTLPMPVMDGRNGWQPMGLEAKAAYSDGCRMTVEVPESGFIGSLDLPKDIDLSMYDEKGICQNNGLQGVVYGISGAEIITENGKAFLEITQYISGKNAVSEAVGYLTSRLYWKDGQYQVAGQRVVSMDVAAVKALAEEHNSSRLIPGV